MAEQGPSNLITLPLSVSFPLVRTCSVSNNMVPACKYSMYFKNNMYLVSIGEIGIPVIIPNLFNVVFKFVSIRLLVCGLSSLRKMCFINIQLLW